MPLLEPVPELLYSRKQSINQRHTHVLVLLLLTPLPIVVAESAAAVAYYGAVTSIEFDWERAEFVKCYFYLS